MNGKIKRYALLLTGLVILCGGLSAQRRNISGTVRDAVTREALIGASVYDADQYAGVTTNEHGFYSLSLREGEVHLVISFVGYKPFETRLLLERDTILSVALEPNLELEEVVVRGESLALWVKNVQPGQVQFPVKVVKSLPSLLGENDVMKTIQLLPGVKSGNDGMAGLYVRGGNMDENLYLMDGIPLYNPSHLMGFFSTFSSDAVKHVDFYKGSFPARYGGRLSSVVDVRLKEGDKTAIHGSASLGLIAAKFNLEGPLDPKTSFLFSARRMYAGTVLSPMVKSLTEKDRDYGREYNTGDYSFTDINAKLTRWFSERDQLSLSLYWGHDYTKYGNHDRVDPTAASDGTYYGGIDYDARWKWDWGNTLALVEYGRKLSPRLYGQLSFSYNRYVSNIGIRRDDVDYWLSATGDREVTDMYRTDNKYRSGIRDWIGKAGFEYNINPSHRLRFGAEAIHHHFTPEISSTYYERQGHDPVTEEFDVENNINGAEFSLYVEDDVAISEAFRIHPGVRATVFRVEGTNYFSVEPRFSMQYAFSERFSFKGAYARMSQYVHLLAFGGVSMPSDLWVPVTPKIKPMVSEQVGGGFYYRFNKGWNLAAEGYYKTMDRLIEYLDGATILPEYRNWEESVALGKGDAYGMELQLQKSEGSTTGWINYTLAWANRWFPGGEINYGKHYPAKNDNRHGINIVVLHRFSRSFDISGAWVFHSGSRATISLEYYKGPQVSGTAGAGSRPTLVDHIEYRNNYRLPSYHRLDLGLNFHRHGKRGTSTWNISVYNAYCRLNPFFVYADTERDSQGKTVPVISEATLFPIIPSISYTFKF